jgi:hypothetical protein
MLAALRAVELVYRELYDTGAFGTAVDASMAADELDELGGQAQAEALDRRFRALSEVDPALGRS